MNNDDVRCVLLADQHHGLLAGVRGLLDVTFDVVVMVSDETSLLETAARLPLAVAVVDLSLVRGKGIQMVRRLRARCPDLKLILLSVHDESRVSDAALAAGADGFVLKRALATDLLPAVDAVLGGQRYVSAGVGRHKRGA